MHGAGVTPRARLRDLAQRLLPGRLAVIGLPWLWLGLFFLLPFAIVLKISLAEVRVAMPPYTPLLQWAADGAVSIKAVSYTHLTLPTNREV